MKIGLISHLFPTKLHPYSGKFIKDQFTHLKQETGLLLALIVPTPYAIPFTKRHKKNTSTLLTKGESKRIFYLSFPARKFSGIISKSISKQIKNYFKNKDFDIIHIHWLFPDALCIPQLKRMGFKCVLTIHGSDWYQTKDNPKLVKLFSTIFQSIDYVLYSGPKLKKDIETAFPELSSKSDIIYNFVDESVYTPASKTQKAALRKSLHWHLDDIHALTVANIRYEKGIDILIDAIKKSNHLNKIHFHIIGAEGDRGYVNQVKETINRIPLLNITIHQPVSPNELTKFYQASDFFIQPSRREGFSVAILEALSSGLPIVATNVGGNHLVVNNKTGLLVQAPFIENLHSKILELSANLGQYNSAQIREQVISQYGKKAFTNRLLDIYSNLS